VNVHYYSEATQTGYPGREVVDQVLPIEELPPLARREVRDHGLAYLLDRVFHWKHLGIDLWWWVRES
jgi:hypothetical protein